MPENKKRIPSKWIVKYAKGILTTREAEFKNPVAKTKYTQEQKNFEVNMLKQIIADYQANEETGIPIGQTKLF